MVSIEPRSNVLKVNFFFITEALQLMCGVPVSYADIYNEVFVSDDKEKWVKNALKKTSTLSLREQIRMIRNLKTFVYTQINEKQQFTEICSALEHSSLNLQRIRLHRTKRLVRKMLRHTYRPPSGRMFRRCVTQANFPM